MEKQEEILQTVPQVQTSVSACFSENSPKTGVYRTAEPFVPEEKTRKVALRADREGAAEK